MKAKIPIAVGALLFGAVALATIPDHVRSIQADIGERSDEVLKRNGVNVDVRVDGRDVLLRGLLPEAQMKQRAVEVVASLAGVRSVRFEEVERVPVRSLSLAGDDDSAEPAAAGSKKVARHRAPKTSLLRVGAELRADGRLTLRGQAPDEATKKEWLRHAAELFVKGEVEDRLKVESREGHEHLKIAVTKGLTALHRLEEGRLGATNTRIRVSGKARDKSVEEKLRIELATMLPPGLRVAIDVYTPRRKQPSEAAEKVAVVRSTVTRGRDNSVILSGIAASEEIKKEWLAKATEVYTGKHVRDRLQVRSITPPESYGRCFLAALPWVGDLINGRVEVNSGLVRVFGKARSRATADRIKSELEANGCKVDVARLAVIAGGKQPEES